MSNSQKSFAPVQKLTHMLWNLPLLKKSFFLKPFFLQYTGPSELYFRFFQKLKKIVPLFKAFNCKTIKSFFFLSCKLLAKDYWHKKTWSSFSTEAVQFLSWDHLVSFHLTIIQSSASPIRFYLQRIFHSMTAILTDTRCMWLLHRFMKGWNLDVCNGIRAVFIWSIFIRAAIDPMTCYNLNWPKIKFWVHYFVFSCSLDHILKR